MFNTHIEIDMVRSFCGKEFTDPMPLAVVEPLSYFHSTESDKKLTMGKVDDFTTRDVTLREFMAKVEAQLQCVREDERYDRLTIVLRNVYKVVNLTYHIRYNPTRFKVNGKNVYHGEIYFPEEESAFKEEDEKIAANEAALRKRLANDPEYLKSVIKDYQVLNMGDMIRDLYFKEFNKYCPYVIGYHHKRDENGFSIGEPMFMGEIITSIEWNTDEEAKDIPDLYVLETIEVEGNEDVFDYKLTKVEHDFYDRLNSPVKITVHEDK